MASHDDSSHGHGHGHNHAGGGECRGHGQNEGHRHHENHGAEQKVALLGNDKLIQQEQRKLRNAVFFVLFMMLAEIVGGLVANSLAILTDAAHLLSDVGGFIVSLFCLHLSAQASSKEYSYGFKQAEVLGALLSISIVWGLTAYILVQAIYRLYRLEDINAPYMLGISVLGVIVNLILMQVLGHDHGHGGHGECGGHGHGHSHGHGGNDEEASLAMKAAIAHVIGDIVQSISVCIAAALIWWRPIDLGVTDHGVDKWNYADPICSFVFGILVLFTTLPTSRRAINVLMIKSPEHVNQAKVVESLLEIPGVISIHDLHVWTIGSNDIIGTAHILISDKDGVSRILQRAIEVAKGFGISHSTFQLEVEGEFDPLQETYGIHENPFKSQEAHA